MIQTFTTDRTEQAFNEQGQRVYKKKEPRPRTAKALLASTELILRLVPSRHLPCSRHYRCSTSWLLLLSPLSSIYTARASNARDPMLLMGHRQPLCGLYDQL